MTFHKRIKCFKDYFICSKIYDLANLLPTAHQTYVYSQHWINNFTQICRIMLRDWTELSYSDLCFKRPLIHGSEWWWQGTEFIYQATKWPYVWFLIITLFVHLFLIKMYNEWMNKQDIHGLVIISYKQQRNSCQRQTETSLKIKLPWSNTKCEMYT